MANTHSIWEASQHQTTQRSHQPYQPGRYRLGSRERFSNDVPTEFLQWLRENEPQDYSELQTLRQALYGRRLQMVSVVETSDDDKVAAAEISVVWSITS